MKKLLYLISISLLTLNFSACSNKCKDVVCQNNGTCNDGLCECPSGFSGTNCEIEDLCITQNVQCLNGGTCADGKCDCVTYYRGSQCQTYCVHGNFNPTDNSCNCYPGWEADGCTLESRKDFIGTYSVDAPSCNQAGPTTETISAKDHPDPDSVAIAVNYVNITGLTAKGDTKGYGLIDGNYITIPYQTVKSSDGTNFTVESKDPAELSGNGFTIVIIRKLQGNPVECTLTYTKQ